MARLSYLAPQRAKANTGDDQKILTGVIKKSIKSKPETVNNLLFK